MLYQLSYASNFKTTFTGSGRRDSNPRPQAWKASALPTELLPHYMKKKPAPTFHHGGGRIRTFEGVSRQIYSLLPLATWVPHLKIAPAKLPNPEKNQPSETRSKAHTRSRSRADGRNRTGNLLITNQLLRQLSYVSKQRFFASLQ